MQQHPYIGLKATRPAKGSRPEVSGHIVFVGQGGSTANEGECAEAWATLLLPGGTHLEWTLAALVVDHAEAERRLAIISAAAMPPDGWEIYVDATHGRRPGEWIQTSNVVERFADALAHTPIGPWEPLGNGEWRRPYRFNTFNDGSKP